MIGLGVGIDSNAEFNRRAVIALRQVTFPPASGDKQFAGDMITAIPRGRALTVKQQLYMFRVVHKYRRQITDALILEYAASRTNEA